MPMSLFTAAIGQPCCIVTLLLLPVLLIQTAALFTLLQFCGPIAKSLLGSMLVE